MAALVIVVETSIKSSCVVKPKAAFGQTAKIRGHIPEAEI